MVHYWHSAINLAAHVASSIFTVTVTVTTLGTPDAPQSVITGKHAGGGGRVWRLLEPASSSWVVPKPENSATKVAPLWLWNKLGSPKENGDPLDIAIVVSIKGIGLLADSCPSDNIRTPRSEFVGHMRTISVCKLCAVIHHLDPERDVFPIKRECPMDTPWGNPTVEDILQ
jgi:hypothetical protein